MVLEHETSVYLDPSLGRRGMKELFRRERLGIREMDTVFLFLE